MAYSDYYTACSDDIDPHFCADCDSPTEKGRIRRGGWLRHAAYPAVMVDPTSAAVWNTAIAAGDFIVLPELSGTFDGGAPKYGPGFGDTKEKFLGADYAAVIKDPSYKENWPHYRSLVGKSSWHLVYVTETQLHISGVPVTVAPKNPITENVDDDVIWESEVKWFETFTPAPHDAPMEIFTCTPGEGGAVTTFEFMTGSKATEGIDNDDVNAGSTNTGTSGQDIVAPDGAFATAGPEFCFMAEPLTEPAKTTWYNTAINNGDIGPGETFEVADSAPWRIYYTTAATEFTGPVEFRLP
jgi:hypothetical protein